MQKKYKNGKLWCYGIKFANGWSNLNLRFSDTHHFCISIQTFCDLSTPRQAHLPYSTFQAHLPYSTFYITLYVRHTWGASMEQILANKTWPDRAKTMCSRNLENHIIHSESAVSCSKEVNGFNQGSIYTNMAGIVGAEKWLNVTIFLPK